MLIPVKKIKLTQGKVVLVDAIDFEWLSKYKWYYSYYGYAVSNQNGRKIYMHRLIMQTPEGMETDHANMNRLDNTRTNLRNCEKGQQRMNSGLRQDNTSGFKGVKLHKKLGRWEARIGIGGKTVYLGLYDDVRAAAKAYDEAAIEQFGKYARLNLGRA
jgi:hypothetical protein